MNGNCKKKVNGKRGKLMNGKLTALKRPSVTPSSMMSGGKIGKSGRSGGLSGKNGGHGLKISWILRYLYGVVENTELKLQAPANWKLFLLTAQCTYLVAILWISAHQLWLSWKQIRLCLSKNCQSNWQLNRQNYRYLASDPNTMKRSANNKPHLYFIEFKFLARETAAAKLHRKCINCWYAKWNSPCK